VDIKRLHKNGAKNPGPRPKKSVGQKPSGFFPTHRIPHPHRNPSAPYTPCGRSSRSGTAAALTPHNHHHRPSATPNPGEQEGAQPRRLPHPPAIDGYLVTGPFLPPWPLHTNPNQKPPQKPPHFPPVLRPSGNSGSPNRIPPPIKAPRTAAPFPISRLHSLILQIRAIIPGRPSLVRPFRSLRSSALSRPVPVQAASKAFPQTPYLPAHSAYSPGVTLLFRLVPRIPPPSFPKRRNSAITPTVLLPCSGGVLPPPHRKRVLVLTAPFPALTTSPHPAAYPPPS
jgi:hypothetical protein